MNIDSKDFAGQMEDNGTYSLGEEVIVCWTNCGNAYAAEGTISKINSKSILVALSEDVRHLSGVVYPAGQKIKAPRIGTKQWSWNNRVYRPVQQNDKEPEELETEVFTYTTAGEEYDGFGTKTVNPKAGVTDRGKVVRLVSTPVENLNWQRMRYGSGLHAALDQKQWQEWLDYGFAKKEEEAA